MSHDAAISPQLDDAEIRMRRNLGLDQTHNGISKASVVSAALPANDVSVASPANGVSAAPAAGDPMRGARQAIRSQAAAREYVERQLAHAEATLQDLRSKLHHARQEKDVAIESARSAAARKLVADRALAATEAALAAEKASHERSARALREAQAVIRDLQARLETTTHGLQAVTAELAAEQQARRKADGAPRTPSDTDGVVERHEVSAESDTQLGSTVAATGKRRGRPPKIVAAAEPATGTGHPMNRDGAAARDAGHDVADAPKIRRPVGRPRKIVFGQPIQRLADAAGNQPGSFSAIDRTGEQPNGQRPGRFALDQEPVQWWVKGWKPGRA